MPTYRNITETIQQFQGTAVAADALVYSPKYIYPIPGAPTAPKWELVTHADSPITKLHDAVLPVELTGLAGYVQILITNNSGDVVSCVFNGDTDNSMKLLDGTSQPIDNEKDIDTLDITGDGTTSVYVYGVK